MAALFFRRKPVAKPQHVIFGPIWLGILNIFPIKGLRDSRSTVLGKTPGRECGLLHVFSSAWSSLALMTHQLVYSDGNAK
jgi:hypothetical protein